MILPANEITEFTDAILNDVPVTNGSAEDALKTMELVYKIYCADGLGVQSGHCRSRGSQGLSLFLQIRYKTDLVIFIFITRIFCLIVESSDQM